jgi:hypothetical protein
MKAPSGKQEDARLVNNKNYPEIAEDFAGSIRTSKTLPADVFLGAHSWFFDLAGKYKRLGAAANPCVDPAGTKRGSASWRRTTTRCLPSRRRALLPTDDWSGCLRLRSGRDAGHYSGSSSYSSPTRTNASGIAVQGLE